MHDATLGFSYRSSEVAATVERALRRELGAIQGDRSTTSLDRDGATVRVRIEAEDPRALRAAKNTWFSLVRAAEGTVEAAR